MWRAVISLRIPSQPQYIHMSRLRRVTHRSITFSVAPFCECTRVVPRLYLSEPASLCRLKRPDKTDEGPESTEEGPGSEIVCPMAGVPGTEEIGVSAALSTRLLVPTSRSTRESTSLRAAAFGLADYACIQSSGDVLSARLRKPTSEALRAASFRLFLASRRSLSFCRFASISALLFSDIAQL